jgi:hypothetical protein
VPSRHSLRAACLLGVRLLADNQGALAQMFVVTGAGLVIAAHAINIRLCRRAGAGRCRRLDALYRGPLDGSAGSRD